MQINKQGDRKFIKFSMAFSNVPVHSKIFTDQSFVSEDFALKELIQEYPLSRDNILVFDRGVQARSSFEEFNQNDLTFVTRLNNYTRFETIKESEIKENQTERLLLEKDLEVKLYDKRNRKTQRFLRLIITKEKESGEAFYFLTNSRKALQQKISQRFTNNDGRLKYSLNSSSRT